MVPTRRHAAALALFHVLCLTPPAFAQSRATLAGIVLDPVHLPVVGATVSVTSPPTAPVNARSTAPEPPPVVVQTGADGRFALVLPPGTYTLTVSAPGFSSATQSLSLNAQQTVSPQILLEIEGLQQSVTVSASAGFQTPSISSATRTMTPLRDVPQSVTVVTKELMRDQLMNSVADVVRYIPGVASHQGENNRDQVVIRGNSSSADFFVNGVRDDVQYYRDLYNLERLEALKGPNALMFGRGGAGGVMNRVTKEAQFMPVREALVQAGTFGHKRATLDFGQPLSSSVALRVNAVGENSASFRSGVDLQRGGVNPTLTFVPTSDTRVTVAYEYLHDRRVADRGITSYQGRPADVPIDTFYGNAADSHVRADVHLGTVAVEHRIGRSTLRNRTLVGDYGRFYQNYVPGAADTSGSFVAISAYNNATDRTNVFNQTDLTWSATTGSIRHTVLAGAEVGRQATDNRRATGFFNNTASSILVPFADPVTSTPVTFRPNVTDADNHVLTTVAAAFTQDQLEFGPHLQVLAGVRFDRFDLEYHNNRTGDTLRRPDNLVSPRAGVIVKPITPLSLYSSYSVSYLPSSGDQFSSLTAITQQVEPEKLSNYEVGAKWDAQPALSVTAAVYRLDRTNTRATDPNDPTRIVQTGSQRTSGVEFGVNGRISSAWNIAGGYAYQEARVVSATVSARAGATVGQVPQHTFSLWNNYQLHRRIAVGLGVSQRADMFATIDNSVVLPGYWRADAAAFVTVARQLRLQVNVENLANTMYYLNADSNTNISPGSPRSVRVALVTRF